MAVFFTKAHVTAVLFPDENARGLRVSAGLCYHGGLSEVFPQEAIELADYFEDVYVGRPRRNGICSAEFSPKPRSVYESALDVTPRTNNSVEAWHYGLQVIAHNFYATNFIKQISLTVLISYFLWSHSRLSEQRKVRFTELVGVPAMSEERAGPKRNELSQAAGGITATRVSRKQQTYNKRLQRILQRFDETNNMVILEACARSITL
ncbi:hypothetical protein HPB48_010074 [Haemaphysalis longicornis]|uniref:Uncharacterized protein n=1 Tax=Haemaphysalis longicornis TaxID=44386 RepID=A0A9J6GUF1_HAELO|nr:hypothetical protein HPB48_010074 [Haemaphysalis longicornis]